MKKLAFAAAFALCLAPIAACDDGANSEGAGGTGGAADTHTVYEGTFTAGTIENGLITIELHSDGDATGMLMMASAPMVDLTGTFTAPAVHLTGGGYDFTGTVTGSAINGAYAGPNGAGIFTLQDTTGGVVQVYCGTYTDGASGGTWNLVEAADGSLSGVANPGGGALTGTRSGETISLTFDGGTAIGTVAGTTASGSWTVTGGGGGGDWTGTVGDCD